jgi:hypothetical protein
MILCNTTHYFLCLKLHLHPFEVHDLSEELSHHAHGGQALQAAAH